MSIQRDSGIIPVEEDISMLPPGHIAYTWGALNLWQRCSRSFPEADYRWVALAAILPDVIDKPLALLVFTDSHTTHCLGHTLLFHLIVLLAVTLWWRKGLVYALAFNGHLLADRMWQYPHTLFYPFLGWHFERWRFMGSLQAMLEAYMEIIQYPGIILFELGGLIILGWLIRSYGLYRWREMKRFLLSGRMDKSMGGSRAGYSRRG